MIIQKSCKDCIYCEDYFKEMCRCSIYDVYYDSDRATYCDKYDDIFIEEENING